VTFSSLIHACSISGQQSRAEFWFRSMVRAGIEPNLLCYNMVIHACALNGNCGAAIDWFGQLLRSNLIPDKRTYTSLIEVSARTGDADSVDLILRDMISDGFHPDELTTLALARGRAHAANPEDRTDVWANCMIMRALASMGKTECVQQWHEKLIIGGMDLPQAFYEELAHLCGENPTLNDATIQPTLTMLQQKATSDDAVSAINLYEPDDLSMIISTLQGIISITSRQYA